MADKEYVVPIMDDDYVVPIMDDDRADDRADNRVEYDFDQKTVAAHRFATEGNWKCFKEIFVKEGNAQNILLKPFDLIGNTAIYLVARSENATLLRELMGMLDETKQKEALTKRNDEGNTLFHGAILCENVEMVNVIKDFGEKLQIGIDQLLFERNHMKETPVFRAAKLGKLKMLKHIHDTIIPLEAKYFPHSEFNGLHRPILHYCLLTFKFDVAIWLVNKMGTSLISHVYSIENDSTGKIEQGFTCFQLLSKMPMAFRSTDTRKMRMTEKLVYYLLPNEGYESELELDDAGKNPFKSTGDIESGQADDEIEKPSKSSTICSSLYYSVWKHVAKAFHYIEEIWGQKKRHKFAEHVAKLLVIEDPSSRKLYKFWRFDQLDLRLMPGFPSNVTVKKNKIELKNRVTEEEDIKKNNNNKPKPKPKPKEDQAVPLGTSDKIGTIQKKEDQAANEAKEDQANYIKSERKWEWETPLFAAAASGIIEVVKIIVDDYPLAIAHVNWPDGLNILHMAIKHRQLEIYEFLVERSVFKALAPRICNSDGRTILHQAVSMEYYREQMLPGVAYQLQDELEWYHRVESIVPDHYLMHCDNEGLTAGDLLDIEHSEMHDQAKQWMKETAQSCSTVAGLIAGVVFAAAYAIPGGNEGGQAVLRNSRAFKFFTVMDVVALASSLGSVVMFLSILTSSFDLWEFHKSLPRKLKVGFIMLFCALITTMLAFAATILLTIHMEGDKKKTTFIYSLAFVIVSMFGLTQFPIYRMVEDMVKQCSKNRRKKKPIHYK